MWNFFLFTSCRRVYWCVRDYSQLCLVCPLINYTLATEENVCDVRVCEWSNHSPFTWNEFYHNTQPETISNIRTRYIFQSFFRENKGDFTKLHNGKKISLEVTCKRNRLGYWNLSKCLTNFVNVAALHICHIVTFVINLCLSSSIVR